MAFHEKAVPGQDFDLPFLKISFFDRMGRPFLGQFWLKAKVNGRGQECPRHTGNLGPVILRSAGGVYDLAVRVDCLQSSNGIGQVDGFDSFVTQADHLPDSPDGWPSRTLTRHGMPHPWRFPGWAPANTSLHSSITAKSSGSCYIVSMSTNLRRYYGA
jgi:hypothetical protein